MQTCLIFLPLAFTLVYGQGFQLFFGSTAGPTVCKDKLPNCYAFGDASCKAPYEKWAKDYCPVHCGMCPPGTGVTTPEPPCENKMDNCEAYQKSVCQDTAYKQWAFDNCRYYCRLCSPGALAIKDAQITTIPPELCVDKLDDCKLYGKSSCVGEYKSWAKDNCRRYCGVCMGKPTPAPPCRDKIPTCQQYQKDTCTSPKYKGWAEDNCNKYCGFCTDGSTSGTLAPPFPGGRKRNNGVGSSANLGESVLFETAKPKPKPKPTQPPATMAPTQPPTTPKPITTPTPTTKKLKPLNNALAPGASANGNRPNVPVIDFSNNSEIKTTGGTTAPPNVATKPPTNAPVTTKAPTNAPVTTKAPTNAPVTTKAPTNAPVTTKVPTNAPVTTKGTNQPTQTQTTQATNQPKETPPPTKAPTKPPTQGPTGTTTGSGLTGGTGNKTNNTQTGTGSQPGGTSSPSGATAGTGTVTGKITARTTMKVPPTPMHSTTMKGPTKAPTTVQPVKTNPTSPKTPMPTKPPSTQRPPATLTPPSNSVTLPNINVRDNFTDYNSTDTVCKDLLNCRVYPPEKVCTNGSVYLPWAKVRCRAYCGFCQLNTSPKPCVDKIPNCNEYDSDLCTNPLYRLFREDNCLKFCNLCTGGTAGKRESDEEIDEVEFY